MFKTATRTEGDRRVSYSFDGPVIESESTDTEVWHVRYKITFSHSKQRKRFEADVWKAAASTRDGYAMERFEMFSGNSAMIATESATRFSQAAFERFIHRSMHVCIGILEDPESEFAAAKFLREIQSLSAVAS